MSSPMTTLLPQVGKVLISYADFSCQNKEKVLELLITTSEFYSHLSMNFVHYFPKKSKTKVINES